MRYKREYLWILLPFVIGLGGLYFIPAPPLSLAIIVLFWVWVGTRFACLDMPVAKSFTFGNSVWAVCLLLFIWQFLLEGQPHRLKALEVITQSYVSPFYFITGDLPSVTSYYSVSPSTASIMLTLVSYLLMLVLFTLGFAWGRIKRQPLA